MSKLSALKKALKTTGKIAAAGAAGKVAYDILKDDSKPKPLLKNPYEKGTKDYVQWEMDTKKRRTGKP